MTAPAACLPELLYRLERGFALEAPNDLPERGGEPSYVVVKRGVLGARGDLSMGRRLAVAYAWIISGSRTFSTTVPPTTLT